LGLAISVLIGVSGAAPCLVIAAENFHALVARLESADLTERVRAAEALGKSDAGEEATVPPLTRA
jgi:hypothetical protein